MDREDIINMAIDAGATGCANPDKWEILEISYKSLERFAKEVDAQARKEIENEALTKNIVANWPYNKWVGLTEEEIKECFKVTPDHFLPWHIYARIEDKLRSKNT